MTKLILYKCTKNIICGLTSTSCMWCICLYLTVFVEFTFWLEAIHILFIYLTLLNCDGLHVQLITTFIFSSLKSIYFSKYLIILSTYERHFPLPNYLVFVNTCKLQIKHFIVICFCWVAYYNFTKEGWKVDDKSKLTE